MDHIVVHVRTNNQKQITISLKRNKKRMLDVKGKDKNEIKIEMGKSRYMNLLRKNWTFWNENKGTITKTVDR